jgi:hypothetical protein
MRLASVVSLGLVLMVTACASSVEPDTRNSASGTIVAKDIRISIGDPPSIHVRGGQHDDECGVIYLVGPGSEIRRRTTRGIRPATYADLKVGTKVRVWAGITLTSCPGQSGADTVEIIR